MNERLLAAVSAYKAASDAKKQSHLQYLSAKDELRCALTDCGVHMEDLTGISK